jgi:homoaconitase/3-isopropylmalate dehydratase large subunit
LAHGIGTSEVEMVLAKCSMGGSNLSP